MRGSRVVRITGMVLMGLWGLLAGLFVTGYAFEDLPLVRAILETAAWVLPMIALAVLGWRGPEPLASRVFIGAIALLGVAWATNLIWPRWWGETFDEIGPVLAVAGIAVAVPLAALARRKATLAGALLVVLAFLPIAGVGGLVGGFMRSATIASIPNLLIGTLFLMSGAMEREAARKASYTRSS